MWNPFRGLKKMKHPIEQRSVIKGMVVNAIKTIVVVSTADNQRLRQKDSRPNKKTNEPLLANIEQGGYVLVPAIGQLGDEAHPYAVFNMSLDTAKRLNGKYRQASFIYGQLNDDGSVHSEYWEKEDGEASYNRHYNGYIMKDQSDEWNDWTEAEACFTIVGKKFKCSIPISALQGANRLISNNATKLVVQAKMRWRTSIDEGWLIDKTINGVGYSPYLWRKALVKE